MPEIAFSSNGVSFQLKQAKKTREWLTEIASKEGRKIDSLTYVFVSDGFLAKLNEQFLGHNTFTDILTFDYSEKKSIVGEIYISIPRVRENAKTFQQSFENELRRVIAHGLLHILGYQDKTARQSAQMRRKEEACLSLWS
jgi:probable rRNA maturation factor